MREILKNFAQNLLALNLKFYNFSIKIFNSKLPKNRLFLWKKIKYILILFAFKNITIKCKF